MIGAALALSLLAQVSSLNPPTNDGNPAVSVSQDQPKATVTAADGSWSVTWDRTFLSPPTSVQVDAPSAGYPYICPVLPSSITTTGASGKCYQLTPTTLPGTVTALPGFALSPFVNAAAGLPVMVHARQ